MQNSFWYNRGTWELRNGLLLFKQMTSYSSLIPKYYVFLFSGSHANPHWREAISVQVLLQRVRSIREPCCAWTNSHWRKAIWMQVLWETFHPVLRSEKPLDDSYQPAVAVHINQQLTRCPWKNLVSFQNNIYSSHLGGQIANLGYKKLPGLFFFKKEFLSKPIISYFNICVRYLKTLISSWFTYKFGGSELSDEVNFYTIFWCLRVCMGDLVRARFF